MFRKALIILGLMLISGVLLDDSAHTHSGRTDANGGHYNRKTGTDITTTIAVDPGHG